MNSTKKQKTSAGKTSQASHSSTFKRTLERNKKNYRGSLAKAISECPSSAIPSVVSDLAKSSTYRILLAPVPFPTRTSQLPNLAILNIGSPEKIYLWNASVVACFAERLRDFITVKKVFEDRLVLGDFVGCDQSLSVIEQIYGQSLWLVKNKILLLQLRSGFVAQKEYLSELLESHGGNTSFGVIAYYKSASCEQNVSMENLADELSNPLNRTRIGDYLKYHIFALLHTSINSPCSVVESEETQTIIDRYEALVEMATLDYARGNGQFGGYVQKALELLSKTEDMRIKDLLEFSTANSPADWCNRLNPIFDQYTEGDYNNNFLLTERTLEVEAAIASTSIDYQYRDGITDSVREILDSMRDVMLLTDKSHVGAAHLRKVAFMYSPHPVSIHLAAFLERKHFLADAEDYSQLDCLSALKNGFENPWAIVVLAHLRDGKSGLDDLSATQPSSTALKLFLSMRSNYSDGCRQLDALVMPTQRRNTYKGHLALKYANNSDAINYYQAATAYNESAYVLRRVSPHLFTALFGLNRYKECVDLVFSHCLNCEKNLSLYPIHELVEAMRLQTNYSVNIEFPILLFLANFFSSLKTSANLSDVFENFLLSEGVNRPSELINLKEKYKEEHLVYFFRYVCMQKILDGLTIFSDVNDIESERMLICRTLCEIDPQNEQEYSDEIKLITMEANNAELLRLVQSSMIFVDEEGLFREIENDLHDSYNRFIEFKKMPRMLADTAGITQKLGDLINVDISTNEHPSSELEGLFSNILHNFTLQFAMHPAYGLDIHLGTTIRHHTFEGHFRSSFDKEDLLCYKSIETTEYKLSPSWGKRLSNADSSEFVIIERALVKFTEKIVSEIDRYINQLLYVRHVDSRKEGLINLLVDKHERLTLLDEALQCETFPTFSACLKNYCWRKVDVSLAAIHEELVSVSLPYVNRELANLEAKLISGVRAELVEELSDSIVRARTSFQNSTREICGWFRRPSARAHVPFEIESAIAVANAQICNCWSGVKLQLERTVNVPFKIEGEYLDDIIEVLYILMQNIVLHSDQDRTNVQGAIHVTSNCDDIVIVVRNPVEGNITLEERRGAALKAVERFESDGDHKLELAKQNKGSGLSKVWRLLEYGLRKRSALNLELTPNNEFITTLTITRIRKV